MRELNQEMRNKIANMLRPELRADFYKLMQDMPNISEHDEMLRVLQVLMFFMIVAEQVPNLITEERGLFERICAEFIKTAKELAAGGKDCFQELLRLLAELEEKILKTIDPPAIAALVAKNLKQQFELTTIPTVALKLAEESKKLEDAVKKFEEATKRLCNTLNSAAANASKAAEEMDASSSRAVLVIEQGLETFEHKFGEIYRRNQHKFCAISSILGFGFGLLAMLSYNLYTSRKAHAAEPAPVQYIQPQSQPQPPTAKSASRGNR